MRCAIPQRGGNISAFRRSGADCRKARGCGWFPLAHRRQRRLGQHDVGPRGALALLGDRLDALLEIRNVGDIRHPEADVGLGRGRQSPQTNAVAVQVAGGLQGEQVLACSSGVAPIGTWRPVTRTGMLLCGKISSPT